MKGLKDGNVRRRTIRLLQGISLTFFVMLTLVSLQNYNSKLQNLHVKLHVDEEKFEEPIEIVITNNDYETKQKKEYAFTVVTGASENHFCPVKALVYDLKTPLRDLNARVIVYDLGLTSAQREEMRMLRHDGYFDELHVFNFSAYPSFWNISDNRGEYGWKPAIVEKVSKKYPGIIIWLDAGTLPERKYFEELPFTLDRYNGFLSPRSSGLMGKWTHPGVYDYYDDDASKYKNFYNCNGACIAFDTYKTQHIINEWYLCALDKDCIAPVGSSRINHRQDQAVLTYLAARDKHYCNLRIPSLRLHTHQDNNCEKIITFYEGLRNIPH